MAVSKKDSKTKFDVKKVSKGSGAVGSYKEDTGGGEPIWTEDKHGEGRGAWKKHDYKEKRDPGQPRTDDGKFTYNSANGKKLKDISKGKDGKSRGVTVPPQLTGGVNGIKESSVTKGTEDKSQQSKIAKAEASLGHKLQEFEGQWYQKGQVIISGKTLTKKFAVMSFVDSMKEWTGKDLSNWVKNEHGDWVKSGISEEEKKETIKNISDKDFAGQDVEQMKTKVGADAKAEKLAKLVAKLTGKDELVLGETYNGKGKDKFTKKGEDIPPTTTTDVPKEDPNQPEQQPEQNMEPKVEDMTFEPFESDNVNEVYNNHKEDFDKAAKFLSEFYGKEINPLSVAKYMIQEKVYSIKDLM